MFKVNDLVKAIRTDRRRLTHGKTYKVLEVYNDEEPFVTVINSHGSRESFFADRFVIANLTTEDILNTYDIN